MTVEDERRPISLRLENVETADFIASLVTLLVENLTMEPIKRSANIYTSSWNKCVYQMILIVLIEQWMNFGGSDLLVICPVFIFLFQSKLKCLRPISRVNNTLPIHINSSPNSGHTRCTLSTRFLITNKFVKSNWVFMWKIDEEECVPIINQLNFWLKGLKLPHRCAFEPNTLKEKNNHPKWLEFRLNARNVSPRFRALLIKNTILNEMSLIFFAPTLFR